MYEAEEMKKGLNPTKTNADCLRDGTHNAFESNSNHEDHSMNEYDLIYDLIPTGRAHAVSMAELAGLTMNRPRALRRKIADMRAGGYLICSDSCGYYRPETVGELKAWCRQAKSRANTTIKGLQEAQEVLNSHALPKGIERR